jgi:small subunit ribosomal protein S9
MAKKKVKVVVARGKRKEAIARASVKEGRGRVKINNYSLDAYQNNAYLYELLREPLLLAGDKANKVDIDVNVHGGGVMGQIQAARLAIAKGLVAYFNDEKLEQTFYQHDPYLVIEDPRRVEPKKYKGRKARARFQKSYR